MEDKTVQPNQKLRDEVRTLARSHGWPKLWLGRLWPEWPKGVFWGLFLGLGALALLTRGQYLPLLDLLKGGGGGMGLIILAVTTGIGTVVGLTRALKTTSGEQEWIAWLSQNTLKEEDLIRAKENILLKT